MACNTHALPPVVAEAAREMIFEWLVALANMRTLDRSDETERRVFSHVERLAEFLQNEDVYLISAELNSDGCEIELKAFGCECKGRLQELTDWASTQFSSFYVRFAVYQWQFATTFKDKE